MTRDQLRPLENELVILSGRLAEVHNTPERIDYLFTAVRLWRWDGEAPVNIKRKPDAVVDHLWCPVPADYKQQVGMLKRVLLVGRVGWYARANGSTDLSVRVGRTLDLDAAVRDYHDNFNRGASAAQVADAFDHLLQAFSEPDGFPISRQVSQAEAKRRITRWRDEYRRDAETQTRIQLSSKRSGRCRGAGKFRDLLRVAT